MPRHQVRPDLIKGSSLNYSLFVQIFKQLDLGLDLHSYCTRSSFKMGFPWKRIFFGTLTGTALTQLAPKYRTPISPTPFFFLFFFTLLILTVTWKVILYPKVFSPIRHLPGPSVGRKLWSNAEQNFPDCLTRVAPI